MRKGSVSRVIEDEWCNIKYSEWFVEVKLLKILWYWTICYSKPTISYSCAWFSDRQEKPIKQYACDVIIGRNLCVYFGMEFHRSHVFYRWGETPEVTLKTNLL